MRRIALRYKKCMGVLSMAVAAFLAPGCAPSSTSAVVNPEAGREGPPSIHVWYGDQQDFGRLGVPQKWVNVLGGVTGQRPLKLLYSLNGAAPSPLSLGPDGKRLARDGDFNVEIDPAALREGANTVTLVATDAAGRRAERTVTVNYRSGKAWPLPYTVDWSKARSIADAVQVVDGHWRLEADGVRTASPYYDRVLAFGDRTWKDYTVTAAVTIHGIRPTHKGPRVHGSAVAIAARWLGHADDGLQPRVKWYPLGVAAMLDLPEDLDRCSWHVLHGGDEKNMPAGTIEKDARKIELGVRYMMKLRVDKLSGAIARYRAKLWKDGEPEPGWWQVDAEEAHNSIQAGGALLIAHNADVTFGKITATSNDPRE
ncbi:MAG: hypothetical protein ACE15C_01610 [Phycisphaerae bacterium]